MTAVQTDEETPLLRPEQSKIKRTPLPWFQFTIVLFLQLAEPLTSQVIYPFAPQLIRDIGITHGDETRVGYYVGIMQSLFFLTQAMTVLNWSRLSDRIGRKPVILSGLFGLSLSMYCFGLSTTFWGLVLSRCLNGALNGNIGVIKSVLAELTDSTNISQAYALQPISWSSGSVLGPMIGGALARPAERFPSLFGNNEFLKKYPYFLPCAVPATYSVLSWFVVWFWLKETAKNITPPLEYLGIKKKTEKYVKAPTETTQTTKTRPAGSAEPDADDIPESEKPLPLRKLFIRQVILAGGNYATLSLVDISFRAIQPLFYSTPLELGGLGLEPHEIGKILSLYGLLNGLAQVFFFADIHDYLGSKKTFILGIAAGIPLIATFPLISVVAQTYGVGKLVWLLVVVQTVLSIALSFAYGAIFIYIAAASPNRASLGATNGLCQMSVSIFRAIGPALAASLYSLSMQHNYLGGWLVYYVLMGVVGLSVYAGVLLPSKLKFSY